MSTVTWMRSDFFMSIQVSLSSHGAVDADAAGAYAENGEESHEIEIGLFVGHAIYHPYVSVERPIFGDGHADHEHQCGEPGEETQRYEDAADEFGEDDEGQRDAVAEVDRIGEHILQVPEVPEFIETIINAKDETEGHPQCEHGDVEGAFAVCG